VKLERVIWGGVEIIIKSLSTLACVVLGLMGLIIVLNVIGRYFFKSPILGTVEMVEFMMVVIVFLAIPFTDLHRSHVSVDIFTSRFSNRAKLILISINAFLCLIIAGVITYQAIVEATYYLKHMGERTTLLEIPFAPFRLIMVLGFFLLCLTLLQQIFHPAPEGKERKGGFD
jgi:TRAP-type transport system small permease protein